MAKKHRTMKNVTFEKRNNEVSKVKDTIIRIARTANTKEEAVRRLSEVIYGVKLGYGGSHVWCANQSNERLFIITGYN